MCLQCLTFSHFAGSPVSETPVIITTSSEVVKPDVDHSSSCDSRIFSEKKCTSSNEVSNNVSQSHEPNSTLVYHNSAISSSSENSNGVSDSSEKTKSNSFLRPSALSSKTESLKCPLKSPKLNLTPSKFGDSPSPSLSTKSPYLQTKNPFSSAASFAELGESPPNNQSKDANPLKPALGTFSNASTTNNIGTSLATSSPVSVPNFVFGQNLHERVTDNVKVVKNDKSGEATTSNGTSDMLFTSALTNNDVSKENLISENSSNSKEGSSLEEDAARYQEARAMKRKYEEVLVTTGEEEEENILQVKIILASSLIFDIVNDLAQALASPSPSPFFIYFIFFFPGEREIICI